MIYKINELKNIIEQSEKLKERIDMIRAMEIVCKNINDEEIMMRWRIDGVADGDIKDTTKDVDLKYYAKDDVFGGLLTTFAEIMKEVCKDGIHGAFYCDGFRS